MISFAPFDMIRTWDEWIAIKRTVYVSAMVKPQAKQSTRFGKGHAFTSKKKKEYLVALKLGLKHNWNDQNQEMTRGILRATIVFSYPWTKKDNRFGGWFFLRRRVDLDNLAKPLFDSLQGVAYADDSQIVEQRTRKIKSEFVGIFVRIDEVIEKR